jgi:L-lactate dehydrogenase complex protein LldG
MEEEGREMTSRDTIFASIRRSLAVKGDERIRSSIADDRLDRAPKGVIPARAQLDAGAKLKLFIEKAEGVQASVARVASAKEVPGEVARYLRDNNLPAALRMGDDPRLAAMPWKETSVDVSRGRSHGLDLSAISHAESAIAETGTLALVSGHENPTTLNFLPDNHIVVLNAADLVSDLETIWHHRPVALGRYRADHPARCAWAKGSPHCGGRKLRRPMPFCSGAVPAGRAAHGPRALHIVVVER